MFSPVQASAELTRKYYRYLKTIFRFQDIDYQSQFEAQLSGSETLAAGPYLDVTDSFEKGKSIAELISDGTLAKEFNRLSLPLTRPLYRHQINAINKLQSGYNLIVSTLLLYLYSHLLCDTLIELHFYFQIFCRILHFHS